MIGDGIAAPDLLLFALLPRSRGAFFPARGRLFSAALLYNAPGRLREDKWAAMIEAIPNVLVVDDEIQIRRFLRASFELEGFAVSEAANGTEAIQSASDAAADLVILDLALPDFDGAEVLQQLRAWSRVPVIVLSVRSSEAEKVRLLELGADDYVVKPFGMAELLARAKAALRRQARGTSGESVVRVDRLKIDLAGRAVYLDDDRLTLTPKEYRLLQILAQHAGNVVTHQQLLKEVWGQQHLNDTHYLRIFVRKLRQKIETDPNRPRILVTELGVGYRLAVPNETLERAPN
jgi:two-component system, OmpR family, KDP operon response regulator KdpE